MNISPIFAIDGYKLGHRPQYPEGTSFVYGNFTPRSNKHFKTPVFKDPKLLWVGSQAFAMEWLVDRFNRDFFQQPKALICNYFKQVVDSYLGPDSVSVDGVEALHDLQYLPIQVKALPEGTLVEMKTPVLTIQNTKPEFFWLPNYLETLLSAELWPVATAATIAFNYRVLCEAWAKKTCDNTDHIQWQCHDFAARGNMGMGANSLTGMGHLASFTGTDSVYSLVRAMQTYTVPEEGYLYGGSIPATEHSVMCMGTKENELATFGRLIVDVYPSGYVAIVSDTWDYWQVITDFAKQLKDVIIGRDGKVVFRPDSGNPVDIICGFEVVARFKSRENADEFLSNEDNELPKSEDGYVVQVGDKYYTYVCFNGVYMLGEEKTEAEVKGSIQCLWDIFGGTVNSKGYKVLNPKVGLIYGDSITLERAEQIFIRLARKGFASSNIVLGIGSYTYQFVTRDTFGFAMKATYGVVNGEGRAIQKDPKTDDGTKKSLKGLIRHTNENGVWSVVDNVGRIDEQQSDLPTLFLNGKIETTTDLKQVRALVDTYVAEYLKEVA